MPVLPRNAKPPTLDAVMKDCWRIRECVALSERLIGGSRQSIASSRVLIDRIDRLLDR